MAARARLFHRFALVCRSILVGAPLVGAVLWPPAAAAAAAAETGRPPDAAQRPAAAKPDVKPAPRAPVHAAPLVRPKPGAAATPARPHGSRSPAPRPAPSKLPPTAPVPTPAPEPEKPPEPTKGSNTGLVLPRFASLKFDEVNMRTGPGGRYPIDWVYKRRDLPVQITREFDVWRLVEDRDGTKGWINQTGLAPRRTGIVVGAEQDLHSAARDDASPVARLKPGVILRIRSCEGGSEWCQVSTGDYRGWIRRTALWGLLPEEVVQ